MAASSFNPFKSTQKTDKQVEKANTQENTQSKIKMVKENYHQSHNRASLYMKKEEMGHQLLDLKIREPQNSQQVLIGRYSGQLETAARTR